MGNDSSMYFVHCMSSVHVGAGQGVGIVDMPMIREKVTEWPFLPGSSVKGIHREFFRSGSHKQPEEWLDIAFGKASNKSKEDGNAGALVISDARILNFPVASRYGTFTYVTCPLVLRRFKGDTKAAGLEMPELNWTALENVLQRDLCVIHPQSRLVKMNQEVKKDEVYIDEFVSEATTEDSFTEWADWLARQLFTDEISMNILTERIMLVSDEFFQYFVTMCSEIVPRIRIDQTTQIVESGALWNEEYLPAESILYGVIWSDTRSDHGRENRELLDMFPKEAFLQIGGNATVGKGRIRCKYVKGGAL